jgi:glyoxylase-like metal-dependent hydrolase (beta-lactamase superfamily II)
MIRQSDVVRVMTGYFTRPQDEELAGQQIVAAAYLVRHPRGLLLFDTGLGEGDAEADARYQIRRRRLPEVLGDAGVRPDEVSYVVNCHLHFDHCGGNPALPGRPVFAQRREYEAARTEIDYTIPRLVDYAGATYEFLEGEAEILPGITVVPTPGHVPGHQSLVVDCTDGPLLLAGQAFNETSEFARAQFAWSLVQRELEDSTAPFPDWMQRVQAFKPTRALFAHDLAVWEA